MWPDVEGVNGLNDLLTREVTLDLFEPPQRERIRRESAMLAAAGVKQRDIARQLSDATCSRGCCATACESAADAERRRRKRSRLKE